MDVLQTLKSIADRMYKDRDCHLIDSQVASRQINLLLFDEDAYFYYENQFDITPKTYQHFAISYLYIILNKIGDTENMKRMEQKYSHLDQRDLNNEPYKYFQKKAEEILPANLTDFQKVQQTAKMAKYFAFYVNGGFLNCHFTIDHLLDKFENLQSDDKAEISKLLDQMLFIYFDSATSFEPMPINRRFQLLSEQQGIPFYFNENIMKILLQRGFIATQITNQTDNPDTYSNLLIYLLNTKILVLQETICRHVIVTQQSKKIEKTKSDKSDEILRKAMKNLVQPIAKLFSSSNRTLSTLATAALVNLASQALDIKRQLVEEETFLIALKYIKKFGFGYPGLLQFSLQLIYSLCAIQQHIEIFCIQHGLIGLVIDVLEKKRTHPYLITSDSISISLSILRIILGNTQYGLISISKNIQFILELYNNFFIVEQYSEKIIGDVIQLFIKIIQKNQQKIVEIYEETKTNMKDLLIFTAERDEYGVNFIDYLVKRQPDEKQTLIDQISNLLKSANNDKLLSSVRSTLMSQNQQ